jgi:hypothetical protein
MHTLGKAEETIKLEDDDAILVEILTDGQELDSKRYGGPAGDYAVKQNIQRLENTKNPRTGQSQWTISYIGAGSKEEVRQAAAKYGISAQNCAAYDRANTGGAYTANKKKVRKFLASRVKGFTSSRALMSDVEGDLADFSEEEDDINDVTNNDVPEQRFSLRPDLSGDSSLVRDIFYANNTLPVDQVSDNSTKVT